MRAVRLLGVVLSILVAAGLVWWLRNADRRAEPARQEEAAKRLTIVVAAEPLRYGQKITKDQVKIIDWLGTSLPSGAFETIESIGPMDDGPYALTAIADGAPIFRPQITTPGQKPSLSARLQSDEVAVTIPVNTITGVAGFVLPEERVDVILNRQSEQRRFADVILQNVRVLAVNSVPDAGGGEPVQAKSVTFATSREDAQKLVVASGLGEISLVLRSPMSDSYKPTRSISDLEIVGSEVKKPAEEATQAGAETASKTPEAVSTPDALPTPQTQVTVIRGVDAKVVTVP